MCGSNHDRLAIAGRWRIALVLISLVGLAIVFLFQQASLLGLDFTATKSQPVFCSSALAPRVVKRWIYDTHASGVVCLAQRFQNGFDITSHRPLYTASNLLGHQVVHRR
jgi:hypothetical protein